MRRMFAVLFLAAVVGCDQPSPEEVLQGFCAEHPDYQACSRDSLGDQLVAFCLEHPEFEVCATSDSPESEDTLLDEQDQNAYLIAEGQWDNGGLLYSFATRDPHCSVQNGPDGLPVFRADLVEESGTSFSVMLHDGFEVGVHEAVPAVAGPPWIDMLMIRGDGPSMLTRSIATDRRFVWLERAGGEWASGVFAAFDLCGLAVGDDALDASAEPCTGHAVGRFDCQPEFYPDQAIMGEG